MIFRSILWKGCSIEMSGNRTVGDVLLKMECDNRRMLRSLINIKMEDTRINLKHKDNKLAFLLF